MEKIKSLSLVIPAHKQARTIYKNLSHLDHAIKELEISYELVVVIDGTEKDEETLKEAKRYRKGHVRVLGYQQNQGKGHAVRYGMMRAKGDIIGFIDAGMDIDPTGIDMLLNHMVWYNADIIVGSKMHPVSQVSYPLWRKILSWGYRTLTKVLFGFKIRDTQVGLKLFKREVIENVFPKLLVKKFAFDIEILAASYSLGYKRIFEAPVRLDFDDKSSSISKRNFWKAIWNMWWDTMAVFYRVRILHYYQKQ